MVLAYRIAAAEESGPDRDHEERRVQEGPERQPPDLLPHPPAQGERHYGEDEGDEDRLEEDERDRQSETLRSRFFPAEPHKTSSGCEEGDTHHPPSFFSSLTSTSSCSLYATTT